MKASQGNMKLKVVTVDDSPVIARRLEAMLGDMENVTALGNAESIMGALDLIECNVPDVVILDINLKADAPANGIHLLVVLREKYPAMKIIMLTNMTAPQYRNACMAEGADYFFDKSNDFEKINDALLEISQSVH